MLTESDLQDMTNSIRKNWNDAVNVFNANKSSMLAGGAIAQEVKNKIAEFDAKHNDLFPLDFAKKFGIAGSTNPKPDAPAGIKLFMLEWREVSRDFNQMFFAIESRQAFIFQERVIKEISTGLAGKIIPSLPAISTILIAIGIIIVLIILLKA